MTQPPYPGQPGPDPTGGYQPPAAPGQPAYPQPDSGAGYPPPGQGGYPQPDQGGYPQPDQGGYPPPGQGGYPPPGQPGFPPPGQPGLAPQFGAPAPKKKSSALKIVLISVAAILVLCVGGVVAFGFFAKDKFNEAKEQVDNVVAASKITVVEPQTLAGRDKVTDPSLAGSVDALDSEMSKISGTTSSVGAMYGDPAKQDLVMIAAASTLQGSEQGRFDEFTKGMSQGGFSVEGLKDTDPGPLGGIAKCGDTSAAGVPTAVCVWSDKGSVGMVAMLFKKSADLEKEFVTMRGQIELKQS
ncbi:hypothetical protein EV385_1339 [Krasilnikovia cinnamomea]|uniref:Flagellar basal body-associated protein FliL n=1 Tax=Krasilnikovia cinnamomea TaxID=349313 RepID=A0A4V2G6Q6_9ACTN|nr:hypothetical protein [Krasilnikovia cinnamomea]RZU49586.1 hypothetical protein EV385_1339 [Krasilnikovia cinnamomea]